ncbi:MAG: TnsA endonuclease N-terminal domain-containing protein [Atribacterota bacterium]
MIKTNFNPNKHKFYEPKFMEKYKGQLPIITRSSWELNFCRWCDYNESVIEWNSESLAIHYFDPISQKTRRYYPDFTIKIRNSDGNTKIYIVEVKPYNETKPPVKKGRKSKKTVLVEQKTYKRNLSKWIAADNYCKKYGYHFKIITEKDLFS